MSEYLEDPAICPDSITQLHPWAVIKHRIGQELDTDKHLFQKLIYKLQEEKGHQECTEITDSQQYFTYLENIYDLDELLDYLIFQFEHLVTLYIDLGCTDVAELLKDLQKELEKQQMKLERDGMMTDSKFIGRNHYKQHIKSTLFEGQKVKGVCICGLGGFGKTSLAKEICIQQGKSWNVHVIDLREKTSLVELLHATFESYSYHHFRHGESFDELGEQLFHLLRSRTNKNDLILYDNVDDVINVDMQNFSRFLTKMLNELNQMGPSCKIRLLITSRQKLTNETTIEHRFQWKGKKFDGLLEEVELEPLKPEDAQRLFDLCTEKVQIPLPLRNGIVELCGFSPLAIRTIASIIKDGSVAAKNVITNLQAAQTSKYIPEISGIYTCLQQTFDNLDISLRKKLIRLSIFQAAPFDIYAAARVFGAYELTQKKPIVIDAQITLLNLKRHHLVEIDKLRFSSDGSKEIVIKPISSSRSLIQYSLHSLVALFLKEQSRLQIYSQDMEESRKRFVSHYKTVVNKFGILEEKNYLKAQRIMEKNRVHLLYFFKLLESSPETEVEMPAYKSTHDDIITAKRIADIVVMMVDDYERLRFVEKADESAMRRSDLLCAILWRTQKGTLLHQMDRKRLTTEVIAEIETLFGSVEGYEDDAMAAVMGHFYYFKGRFNVEYRNFAVGIECLQKAEKFYKSITSESRNYKSYLARVYRVMGNIYYKREPTDLKMAQMCFEKSLKLVLSRTDNEYKNLDIPCYLTEIGNCSCRAGEDREEQNEDPMAYYNEALKCYNIAIYCDRQMKFRESDDYANKLCRRARVLARIGKHNHSEVYFGRAEMDIRESLLLRRRLLAPPHQAITLTTHVFGDILRMKALTMHQNKREADEILDVIFEALDYYKETRNLIKRGGLDKDHPEYQKIKDNHLWLDRQVNDPGELKKTKIIYKKFEEGHYSDLAEARLSMDSTIFDHMSREEKMKLLHSTDNDRWQLVQNKAWRSASERDEVDLDIGHDSRDEEDCLHLMDALDIQTWNRSDEAQQGEPRSGYGPPGTRDEPHGTQNDEDMEKEDEVFADESNDRTYLNLDDGNSFISFLENYVPSFSEEFGEDFWHLITEQEDTTGGAEIEEASIVEQDKSRKRKLKETTKANREKME